MTEEEAKRQQELDDHARLHLRRLLRDQGASEAEQEKALKELNISLLEVWK
jgi:hypothetical protein